MYMEMWRAICMLQDKYGIWFELSMQKDKVVEA